MTSRPPGEQVTPFLCWLTTRDEGLELELACAEHPSPQRGPRNRLVARLPECAAELPDHVWLEFLTCGVARLRLRLDGCARAGTTGEHLARLARLLTALGHEGRIQVTTEAPAGRAREVLLVEHPPVSRRQLLMLGGHPALRAGPDPSLRPHERFVEAVRRLRPIPAGEPVLAEDAWSGPGVVLQGPDCTLCGMCVRTCPTDALTILDLGPSTADSAGAPHVFRLGQRPSRCDGCLACVDACPVNTLAVVRTWGASALYDDEPQPIVDVMARRCRRCGSQVPSAAPADGAASEVLCAACGFRRQNPFGSSLPPEALSRLSPEVLRQLGYPSPDGEA